MLNKSIDRVKNLNFNPINIVQNIKQQKNENIDIQLNSHLKNLKLIIF